MFLKIVRVVKLWNYFPFEPIVMSAENCPWFSVDQLLMMLELCLRILLRSSTTITMTITLHALRLSIELDGYVSQECIHRTRF